MEDTMMVESRNDEYLKSHPASSTPCILLENVDEIGKGSPKLLHIAKTGPIKHASSSDNIKQKGGDKSPKSDIGRLGKKTGIDPSIHSLYLKGPYFGGNYNFCEFGEFRRNSPKVSSRQN